MDKIHSHYDNLKVARNAPVEVVRAAYKALSQRYHPDKNPDQKNAARVMALLNSAYDVLSDPGRRKEHDDWIAAAEAELQAQERLRRRASAQQRASQQHAPPAVLPVRRGGRWSRLAHSTPLWCALALCCGIGLGWFGHAMLPKTAPAWLLPTAAAIIAPPDCVLSSSSRSRTLDRK